MKSHTATLRNFGSGASVVILLGRVVRKTKTRDLNHKRYSTERHTIIIM